jgi:CBS domain-containing protein
MKVQEVMTSPALTLDPSTALDDAATQMFDQRVAAMPVVEAGCLVGILGEADLYRAVAAANGVALGGTVPFDALGRPRVVSDVMRRQVLWVKSTDNARLAAQLLMRHARSLPVIERGKVVGMVSRRDLIGPLLRGKSIDLGDGISDDGAVRHTVPQQVSLVDPGLGSLATVKGRSAGTADADPGPRRRSAATVVGGLR